MLDKAFLLILFLGHILLANGQESGHGFAFPIKPGSTNGLAGTVGELRATHFHTGLDIKTDGVVGLPVHASMDGYVSRILVGPGGYGLALYLKHPNGYTTVYGHLLEFDKAIANYVLREQYKRKSFAINLYPEASRFPVKQGDIIALSGNSGSSAGPHLHWDVRDAYQRPINSLELGFPEIKDNIPPVVYKAAFRSLDHTGRVNGLFGRYEFRVTKKGNSYHLAEPVSIEGNVGLEILGFDKLNGYPNRCGISKLTLNHNGKEIYRSHISRLSFENPRSIYAYYNYAERIESGDRFHKLYIDDGNDLDFYDNRNLSGIIRGRAQQADTLTGKLEDPYGNTVNLELYTKAITPVSAKIRKMPEVTMDGNYLIINALKGLNESDVPLTIYEKQKSVEIKPAIEYMDRSMYIIDLRKYLPDSVKVKTYTTPTYFSEVIPSGRSFDYYSEKMDIHFDKGDLVDTLYLQTQHIVDNEKEIFHISNELIPLKKSIEVKIRPELSYSGSGWAVYATDESGSLWYRGGYRRNGTFFFNTAYLGAFTIARDTEKPKITPLKLKKDEVIFRVRDSLSGVDHMTLTVNGQWVMLYYDAKNDKVWSVLPENMENLSGAVVLTVTDNEGNKSIYQTKL